MNQSKLLHFVLFHLSPLSVFEEKKKIHRITLYRISNDNGSTRNGSRFSREKKNPWNIPCSLRGGCPEWTLKRRRTGGHSYLNFQRRCYGSFAISPAEIPSSPLLLLLPSTTLFAPTDSRLDQTFENRPPPPPPPCNPAEIVVKFHLFRRWFRVELIKGGKKERKKEILFDSRTIVYVQKIGERERDGVLLLPFPHQACAVVDSCANLLSFSDLKICLELKITPFSEHFIYPTCSSIYFYLYPWDKRGKRWETISEKFPKLGILYSILVNWYLSNRSFLFVYFRWDRMG